ncbi:MAG: hypothetical protein Q8P20_07610 [bacterium]|nr:hypothetical protein [bacterium]
MENQQIQGKKSNKTIYIVVILIVIIGAAAAIYFIGGSGETSNTKSDTTSKSATSTVSVTPSVSITTTIDENEKVNGYIQASKGSSLVADIAVTLTVPADSFVMDKEINITPLRSITGSSFDDSMRAAVDLQPSGTEMILPSTLSFNLEQVNVSGKYVGFTYEEDGKNFHLYPITVADGIVTMNITHFSGYGVLDISDAAVDSSLHANPITQADYETQTAVTEGSVDVLKEWFDNSVKKELAPAESNENLLKNAIRNYLSWLGQVQLYGHDDQFTSEDTEAQDSMAKGIVNAIDTSSEDCVNNSDPTEVDDMIFWAKGAMLLGLDDRGGLDIDIIKEKVKSCAQFSLTLESTTEYFDTVIVESGSIPSITLNEDFSSWVGTGEHTEDSWTLVGDVCEPTTNVTFPLNVGLGNISFTSGSAEIALIFEVDAGQYLPEYNHRCDYGAGSEGNFGGFGWLGDFDELHHDEYVGPEMSVIPNFEWSETAYLIKNWEHVGSADVFSKKVYNRTVEGTSEDTTLILRHTPVK